MTSTMDLKNNAIVKMKFGAWHRELELSHANLDFIRGVKDELEGYKIEGRKANGVVGKVLFFRTTCWDDKVAGELIDLGDDLSCDLVEEGGGCLEGGRGGRAREDRKGFRERNRCCSQSEK